MSEAEHELFVDDRIEAYTNYLPSKVAESISDGAKTARILDQFVCDLLLEWRTAAYTAAMPAIFVQSLHAMGEKYVGFVSPDSSVLTFGDLVLAKLSRKLPDLIENRQLRSQLATELVGLASEFRDARSAISPKIDINRIWKEYLDVKPFAMSIWSSQRVTYVAFYNAYEGFLIRCLKQALGVESLRTTSKEFKPALRERFANDIIDPCWINSALNIARLVRHAISHAGGRETADLKDHRHNIRLIDGVLQIAANDNHALLRVLFTAVQSFVTNAVGLTQFV